jgi:hypothetical protein
VSSGAPSAVPLLHRLVGLETEYAIAWLSRRGRPPTKHRLYQALDHEIRSRVETQPGGSFFEERRFTAYGGSYCFEHLPHRAGSGLFEAATPECRGPSTTTLYQRVQDDLLSAAAPGATRALHREGYRGELVVLKNCRDAAGNRYGAQENYEVEMVSGASLWVYRLGLVALIPLLAFSVVGSWLLIAAFALLMIGLLIPLLAVVLALLIAAAVSGRDPESSGEAFERFIDRATGPLAMAVRPLELLVVGPSSLPFAWLLRLFAFRRQRRAATSFFLSRLVFTGAGSLDAGTFFLSEKGIGLRGTMRASMAAASPTIFDTGNLLTDFLGPATLDFGAWRRLWQRRQRMQISFADANACEWAEYLRVGSTLLVLDLVDDGALDDAPQLSRPMAALRGWNRDPRLRFATREHGQMNAFEVQAFHLGRAERWLAARSDVSFEARGVVEAWREALRIAETPVGGRDHPGFGRIDWITKRALLDELGPEATDATRKKIDLKYHQLGGGYLAELDRAGVAHRLTDDATLARLRRVPPESTPAAVRGELVRRFAGSGDVRVSWGSVRVGARLAGRVGGQVIDLAAHRKGRAPSSGDANDLEPPP